tara:strand:- start:1911 stop:2231 length:321 start_codon:yes stop_codon:yes gene_type:complete
MIRLTVLYKLKPEVNESEFLKWRMTEHQVSNSNMFGVIDTTFTKINSAWPVNQDSPYRFMTTIDWADMESFEKGFYEPEIQKKLEENLKLLTDPQFLIGEVLIPKA